MKTIDKILLDSITLQAKETTRLRKKFQLSHFILRTDKPYVKRYGTRNLHSAS